MIPARSASKPSRSRAPPGNALPRGSASLHRLTGGRASRTCVPGRIPGTRIPRSPRCEYDCVMHTTHLLALLLLTSPALAQNVQHGLRLPDGFEVTEFAGSDLANDIYTMTLDPK